LPLDEAGASFRAPVSAGRREELLELPAGVMEAGDEPLTCAGRELREETGFSAGKMELQGDFYLAPGYSDEHMYVVLSHDLHADPLAQDEDEFMELEAHPDQRRAGDGA
jgi:ADP-ribose pyrophosphatase